MIWCVICGMTFGLNMLRADPKLWVPVGANYNGFAYKPSKGWLSNANTTTTTTKHSGHTNKEQSIVFRNTKATVDVCS